MIRRLLISLSVLALFIILAAAGGAWYVNKTLDTALEINQDVFTIEPGASIKRVSRDLYENKIMPDPYSFALLGRYQGRSASIKAGDYRLDDGMTARQLLDKFIAGDVITYKISLVEGLTFRQFREKLAGEPALEHLTGEWSDEQIMQELGAGDASPEGMFFPDTYVFRATDSDLDVLKQSYAAMQTQLDELWQQRDEESPLEDKYQALVLASIIEKETGQASERPLIGGVFSNRLKQGMLLQTDPTIIYGLGEDYDGNLTRAHLRSQDNPYNTYVHAGLPPTPIAMPGLASLKAAVQPETTDKLYFVAKGDGSHEFSRTYEQHRRAVAKYQLNRNNG